MYAYILILHNKTLYFYYFDSILEAYVSGSPIINIDFSNSHSIFVPNHVAFCRNVEVYFGV